MDDFDSWYSAERPRILATCFALSGDLDVSLDATDEAFTRALERWTRVSLMASPGGWTQTVALNILRRALRGRRLRRQPNLGVASHEVPSDLPDPELWAAVRQLPLRQQSAVVLRYVHDLTQDDIALSMGISRGAVASTLAAARSNLARQLVNLDPERETFDGESV